MRADLAATRQQLDGRPWCLRGLVLIGDAMPAPFLAAVLTQELPRARIQHPHHVAVPLHFYAAADPAWRRTVVRGIDFNAAIQVHAPVAKLIQAKRLQRQWQQRGLLFAEHGCYLALGGGMDAQMSGLHLTLPACQLDFVRGSIMLHLLTGRELILARRHDR